jgi:branched-chain amino acid transport system ATP-binding protein
MLRVEGLEASYGESQVLFGIGLEINPGEVVTLLGRNGMGKTTTISSIMGILPPKKGELYFDDVPIRGLPPYRIAQHGIGLVPEGRQVFSNLTVRENLIATAANRQRSAVFWGLDRVLAFFPQLAARSESMGGTLSGGEQQMLAIGRALMTNPRLLILDEATEGLAPLIRDQIWAVLESLKSLGQSILIIDKNVAALMRIADRHYILEKGKIRWSGTSDELRSNEQLHARYLGV